MIRGVSSNDIEYVVDDDMEYLTHYKWLVRERGLERRERLPNGRKKCYYLHREVMGLTDSTTYVYFKNGCRVDCRRENLLVVPHGYIPIEQRKTTLSKYTGVDKVGRKWRARIRVDHKLYYVGLYWTEDEAAIAYNEAAKKAFGLRARLNEVK